MTFLDTLQSVRLKARNYKCFGEEPEGFEGLRHTNVIIGRNNSGKSALLDLVEIACKHRGIQAALYHRNQVSKILYTKRLNESELRQGFREDTSGGNIGGNHWHFGRHFIGTEITVEINDGDKQQFSSLNTDRDYERAKREFMQIAGIVQNIFKGRSFRRLAADRDIQPEADGGELNITKNGVGFTNTVQRHINKSFLPGGLVENDLLQALNTIFEPDATFSAIWVQQHENGQWEVYLEEKGKGRISLGHSGSGLKTVLLVLAYLILLPAIEKRPLSQFVFAFEELENNLHPALQRRLIKFIHDAAVKNECLVFLTTHSGAVIDLLSHDKAAQIIHVTHNGVRAKSRHVSTYYENRGILDDLDIRASDLLQSNGIVWVEGPSDRLYFNRWMQLISDGVLQEGAHYQCVFYGGRLLAHLSGEAPLSDGGASDLVKIFGVNRNAIVVMDSDKNASDEELGETKKRISAEVNSFGGMAWVTRGREIENYIPLPTLQRVYPDLRKPIMPFDDMKKFLERHQRGEGKKFEHSKVLFAERLVSEMRLNDFRAGAQGRPLILDELVFQLHEASRRIAQWNGIAPAWIPERIDCN